ncbi:MAG: cyclic nucleotide-binding domain-containing protein [Candidatus Latescibacteria bacterium]|nr:cyclic nucleotide-binding domain-containing protein [Candidatus Latescibacterota bacterium]
MADPFWGRLFNRQAEKNESLFEVLQRIPIFQDFNQREFAKVEDILHHRSFAVDEAIVREGEKGVGMYIILTGQIQILHAGEQGQPIKLATLGPGDFFGEQALLDESPRTASAVALEPCQAIGFFRPDMLELIDRNPRMGLKVIMRLSQMISFRLRQTNRLLKEARERAIQAERQLEAREELAGLPGTATSNPKSN